MKHYLAVGRIYCNKANVWMFVVVRGRFSRGMMYIGLTSFAIMVLWGMVKLGGARRMLTLCCKAACNTFCPAEFYEKPLYYYDTATQPAVIVFGNIFPVVRFLAKADGGGNMETAIPTASDALYIAYLTDNDSDEKNTSEPNINEPDSNAQDSNEEVKPDDNTQNGSENVNSETDAAQSESEEKNEVSTIPLPTGSVPYSMESLKDFNFVHDNFYTIPPHTALSENLLRPEEFLENDLSVKDKTPCILLYHTHSQEAFADSQGNDMTIVQVGDYLEKLLKEKYGYEVIHVTTQFDMIDGKLDRSKAYTYAQEEIASVINEHPEIDMVIDLHRDGVNESLHFVTDINGKPTAKVMLFNGISYSKNQGNIDYLYNPYLEDNLALTYQMYLLGKTYYPEFFRCIYIEAYRYNLHMCKRSMLIEAGAQTNSFEEVINAMEPLSELIARELSGEKISE